MKAVLFGLALLCALPGCCGAWKCNEEKPDKEMKETKKSKKDKKNMKDMKDSKSYKK